MAASVSQALAPPASEPVAILLVDDQPARLLTYRAILEPLGETLVDSHSGDDALRKVMETEFAVILLDVNMPGMDGFETASMIHQHPRFERTPIIFITAVNVTDLDRLRGYKLGAVDYVLVPVIPEILRSKVSVLVELHRKRRELQALATRLAAANDQLEHYNRALQDERAREVHKLNEVLSAANVDLAMTNDSLQREIGERRRAEERLQEADRRKDEFLATLAHELRNPLAPIQSALAVQRMRQGPGEVPDALFGTIERQTRQLVRLIDDLLDVARITSDKLEMRKSAVELNNILSAAIESAQPAIDRGGQRLILDLPFTPVWLQGDAQRLAQVFANLLNNAAKYSDSGATIRLVARVLPDSVEVSVVDTGIGIASAELQRVFELFAQVENSRERSAGGLGIGLTLVKRLVELHGGVVEAHSAGSGRGSTFSVRLPREPAESSAAAGAAWSPERSQQLRVVVVDDNVDAANMLALALGAIGHDTRVVTDPLRVVEEVAPFAPDLMFVDVGMPRLNGLDLARQIRRQPWGQGVRLVALTGWGQEEDRRRSSEAGFDEHLVKPADIETIDRICRKARRGFAAPEPVAEPRAEGAGGS